MTTTPAQPNLSTLRMESPLGVLHLLASAQGLCGVWFENQQHFPPEEARACWTAAPEDPWLKQAQRELSGYFAGQRETFDVPLDLSCGTPFQRSVWQALLGVGCGQTSSYGRLAQQLNKPKAVRAVGAAVGRNPVSIIVPCHRILGSGGQLTGYAGGLWRKEALLELEAPPDLLS